MLSYLTMEASDVGIVTRLDLFLIGLGAVATGVTGLLAVMAHHGGHSTSIPSIPRLLVWVSPVVLIVLLIIICSCLVTGTVLGQVTNL